MIYHRDLKKSPAQEAAFRTTTKHHRSWWPHAIAGLVGISLIGVVLAATHETARPTPHSDVVQELKIRASTSDDQKDQQTMEKWVEYTIQPGDNASVIFDKYQIHSALQQINALPVARKTLSAIHPGKTLSMKLGGNGLEVLKYPVSETRQLTITREDKRYSAKLVDQPVETRRLSANGTIENSLFLDAKKAGVSDNLIMQMVDIFAYDIDFALDIRKGDQFSIVYDERYVDGKPLKKSGPILAARFINQNHVYTMLRYTDRNGKTGYFTPEGKSNRKAFIRTPVKFTRISSLFNPNRRHPILHTIRAHKGVDYAAPIGTPVKTTGNGTVQFVGKQRGYGNVVIIKHFGGYSTLYAHLSKFKKGLKRGQRVKQGQIIAYVGQTGAATGPHLHYEFRVNGKHKDPLKVKLPNAPSLTGTNLKRFKELTRPVLAQLPKRGKLALAE